MPFITIPGLVHGTAQRDPSTPLPTTFAISLGYRAIDSAPNPSHDEAAVGEHLASAFERGIISRPDLFLITKYSPPAFFPPPGPGGECCPYDPGDRISVQVLKSIEASLERLRVEYVDCYLLHSPFRGADGLGRTLSAWETMQEIVRRGGARCVGVSQVDAPTLKVLCERTTGSDVAVSVVQNHFSARTAFDSEVRAYCRERGIVYQAFGILGNENAGLLEMKCVTEWAGRRGVGVASALFAFLWALGRERGERFGVLDGSRDEGHLRDNLRAAELVHQIGGDDVDEFEDGMRRLCERPGAGAEAEKKPQ